MEKDFLVHSLLMPLARLSISFLLRVRKQDENKCVQGRQSNEIIGKVGVKNHCRFCLKFLGYVGSFYFGI